MSELPTADRPQLDENFTSHCVAENHFGRVERHAQSSYFQAPGFHSQSSFYGDLSNLGGNGISGRPGLSFKDYYSFRPDEKPAETPKGIIHAADLAYKKVDIVRNTIDLMADFVTQGITIAHPVPSIQKFGQNWFSNIVNGEETSERLANYLLRLGNVVARRYLGKPTLKQVKQLYKASSATDKERERIDIESINALKREIPAKYSFIDPCLVEVIGGPLANFAGIKRYGIRIPSAIADIIKNPTDEQKPIVDSLPEDIIKAATNPLALYPLPADKIEVIHYKKDDWETWANPIIGSIMQPLIALEKLNLADMAALDGAINKIRIIKIGNMQYNVKPNKEVADMLNKALQNNTGGGTIDIVTGPDVELIESDTAIANFLGDEKYASVWMRIYAGLGIPPTLTGTFGAGGTTNNFISLKTMINRLNYCRGLLIKFWRKELAILQKAMEFTKPFSIEFDIIDFGDEAAQRALLIQMVDRNLISEERVQRLFNLDPELESIRINRESKQRIKGQRQPKPNPLRDTDSDLRKIALQTGIVSPSEVGLELEEKKTGEKSAIEMKPVGVAGKTSKPKGVGGQGRPKNSKDSGPRKEKAFKPKVMAAVESWAASAQAQINEVLMPVILESLDKKNARCLSNKESDMAEKLKYGVLSSLEPFTDLSDAATIFSALELSASSVALEVYADLVDSTKEITKKDKLSMAELRQLQLISYVQYRESLNEQD